MSADSPTRLPDAVFLIAYDVAKQKLRGDHKHQLVRAGALAELYLRERLVDAGGKVAVAGAPTGDPILEAVVADVVASGKARAWKYWVRHEARATYTAVQARLLAERMITIQEGRALGLFPTHRVNVRDTRVVRQLIADTRGAVLGGIPVDRVDSRRAALVALVADAELNTVFTGRERRQHRDRVKSLAQRIAPVAKAFRSVVVDSQTAAATAATTAGA